MRPLFAAWLAFAVLAQPAHALGEATYAAVGGALKKVFTHTAANKPRTQAEVDRLVNEELKRSYRALGLMDKDGKLLVPRLEKKGLMDAFAPALFIDESVSCLKQNTYLNAFVAAVGQQKNLAYSAGWEAEPKRGWIVTSVVYAKVLDRLTKLVRRDIEVIADIRAHYARHWQADKEFQKNYFAALSAGRDKANIFFRVKLASVDPGVADAVDFIRKKRPVPPSDGRWLIAVNIAEATIADMVVSYQDNARTGGILAENRVGEGKLDPKTGAGPTKLSKDGKSILYSPPLPKKWADLYETWNAAFVSQSVSSGVAFAKLFNPQVACHSRAPSEYLFNRAVALYLHLHHAMYQSVDLEFPQAAVKAGRPPGLPMQWKDDAMTRLWGSKNLIGARSYAKEIECLKPGFFASARATFASLATQVGEAHRAAPNTPEGGPANEAALEAAELRQVDEQVKQWGASLAPTCGK